MSADRDMRPAAGLIDEAFRARLSDRGFFAHVRKELDNSGVACLRDFLSSSAIERLQKEVRDLEAHASPSVKGGSRKYSVKGYLLRGTVIDELSKEPEILRMINAILGEFPGAAPAIIDDPVRPEEVIPGLNIMRGPGDVTAFHFDGTFLNILVPVFIPKMEGNNRGQLTIYPNVRSFRRNFYDAYIVPILCKLGILRAFLRPVEVDYEIGNVYLFYGYRSYHGVLSPGAPGFRCTANLTVGGGRF